MNHIRQSRRRQACVRCRESKVRCDIREKDLQQCSRCQQVNEECVQPPLHPRYADKNKVQKKSLAPLKPVSEVATVPTPPASVAELTQQPSLPALETAQILTRKVIAVSDATARDLNGLFLEGKIITDLLHIYFAKYASLMPILDPTSSADQIYERSPLLFWCVMTVAIRKTSSSRDLMLELTRRTMSLAMSSLNIAAIHVVESLLILLNWWLLTANTIIEIPAVLAGSLLHLAMHIGLHNPVRSQDYVRRVIELSKEQIAHRSLLWAHTVILYQEYWSVVGAPCDAYNDIGSEAEAFVGPLPASLRCRRSLSKVTAETLNLLRKESQLAENGLLTNIDTLIKLGDNQLLRLTPAASSLEELHWLISRMLVYSHHLHQPLKEPNETTLSLYKLVCSVIKCMQGLQSELPAAGTTFVFQASQIAVFTLVALTSNPPFAALVNVSEANSLISYVLWQQQEFELGIIGTDWKMRMAMLVQRLRSSLSAFRNEKGEPTLELRIKTRGPMSVVHDTVWWARQELAGLPKAYKGNQPGYMDAVEQQVLMTTTAPPTMITEPMRTLPTSIATAQPGMTVYQESALDNPPPFNFEDMTFDDDLFLEMNWDFLYDIE